jgi:predicted molibdopterin-dependent oxidoreductase YjgC
MTEFDKLFLKKASVNMTITLTINELPVHARSGQTILLAAREIGIEIPTLCHHKDLSPVGSCRLCVVEVDGWRGEQAACTTCVGEGMIVRTETPAIRRSRQFILEMLLQNYSNAGCSLGDRAEDTEFEKWVIEYQALKPIDTKIPIPNTQYPITNLQSPILPINSDTNPFISVDMNKCILCTRCVRACAEIQGRFVWGVGGRGGEAKIIAGNDTTLLDARCESCGACVAYCPTGALDNKLSLDMGKPDKIVTTTCSYCGVGCQFDVHVRDNKILRVVSNPDAEPNGMHLCVKGRYGYDYVHHPDRLTTPQVRRYLLEGQTKPTEWTSPQWEWIETGWEKALDIIAQRVVKVRRESGPDAVGIMTSAKCTNEENYLMNKFARQVVGTHNIDHCARL